MSKVCHLCVEQQRLGDPQADKVRAPARRLVQLFAISAFTVEPLFVLVVCFQIRVRKLAPKILQLLAEWTETFPYDFRDERMMRSLKELTQRLASGEEVRRTKRHASRDTVDFRAFCTCCTAAGRETDATRLFARLVELHWSGSLSAWCLCGAAGERLRSGGKVFVLF